MLHVIQELFHLLLGAGVGFAHQAQDDLGAALHPADFVLGFLQLLQQGRVALGEGRKGLAVDLLGQKSLLIPQLGHAVQKQFHSSFSSALSMMGMM